MGLHIWIQRPEKSASNYVETATSTAHAVLARRFRLPELLSDMAIKEITESYERDVRRDRDDRSRVLHQAL